MARLCRLWRRPCGVRPFHPLLQSWESSWHRCRTPSGRQFLRQFRRLTHRKDSGMPRCSPRLSSPRRLSVFRHVHSRIHYGARLLRRRRYRKGRSDKHEIPRDISHIGRVHNYSFSLSVRTYVYVCVCVCVFTSSAPASSLSFRECTIDHFFSRSHRAAHCSCISVELYSSSHLSLSLSQTMCAPDSLIFLSPSPEPIRNILPSTVSESISDLHHSLHRE